MYIYRITADYSRKCVYCHNVSAFLISYLPTASSYGMELDVCTHVGKEETNSKFACYEQLHSNQNNETARLPSHCLRAGGLYNKHVSVSLSDKTIVPVSR